MINLEASLRGLKSRVFLMHGRRPYAHGYGAYARTKLQEHLNTLFPKDALPEAWGLWLDERVVEYPWFLSRLSSGPGRLLDAGSVLNHGHILSHRALANKAIFISTLAPESENHCNRGISYVYEDLRECCYRNGYFDWVVSISTLEHVGMNNAFYTSDKSKNELDPESHLKVVAELHRVLKTGGVLYVTLPFGRPQNLGWLQIFDIGMVRMLVNVFGPASFQETYFRYTNAGWQTSSAADCRDARYFDPSKGGTVPTDLAAAEAVVCLELVK
jgi:SAM-dependent methyltransferase